MSDTAIKPHVTERTTMWRSCTPSPSLLQELDTIEEFGWQNLHITADAVCPRFSYTIGVYDTSAIPELITIGLPSGTAQHALNEAIELMKEGVDLTVGRHRDVVGSVEVEFRPVDPKWIHHIMLRVNGYYEGADVPVLQLIYPDLENRFQGDEGFNSYFEQPVLSGEVKHGSLEYDLWAAYDSNNSFSRWQFPDPPHTSSYLSQTVHEKQETVTYVSHDSDGDWQFLGDKMNQGGGPVLSCLHHPIDDDRTLEELYDLPLNWYATREHQGAPWLRFEHETEDDPATN